MEIADFFIVNKADGDGADPLTTDMESMRELGEEVGKSNKSVKVIEGVERWPRAVSIH
jgi:putative protein kinase ArgK-like GTPase of G3E family